MDAYAKTLKARMDPTSSILQGIYARARNAQARMIFAEGDDVRVLRAAVAYQRNGLGKALVVGREADVKEKLESAGLGDAVRELQVVNAANTTHLESYKDSSTTACSAVVTTGMTCTAWRRATGMRSRR
jgi:malate dehydrogenase (oxaloacetate-decarboxylating)(NADP+)